MWKLKLTRRNVRALLLSSAVLLAGAGQAAADLSQSDMAAISAAVQSALAGAANGGQAAQVDALKAVTMGLLGKFGADNDPQVVNAIVADALADGASQQTVDLAMADTIARLAGTKRPGAAYGVPVGGVSNGPVGA